MAITSINQRPNLTQIYVPSDYGKEEEQMMREFELQLEDARNYFLNITKPRLDRAYKLYIAYTGDRQKEIKSWQANIFVPYVQAVVETLMPRVLDARPEFSVIGRTADDNEKAEKQRQLGDYFWEIAGMDATTEDFVRSILVYGTGFLQVSWKKDVRKFKFLKTKDVTKKKFEWKEEERTFYDAPYCEWVDNYSLWYDWHNAAHKSKQFWFKRLVLTENEIKRRYPRADKKRLELALGGNGGDLTDYAAVRQEVRHAHESIVKGRQTYAGNRVQWSQTNAFSDRYNTAVQPEMQMYEVFEWYRPFEDAYAVVIGENHVPIFKNGAMPIPFDFKEDPFISATYLKIPGEFEGYGIPLILENPQIMLNLIKNQRLDAATLNIHKMWIVNPLANINKNELVTRPFGIIYSIDPNGVREVEFSDIKTSAYQEEEALKSDMRYSSGVDDFSMGTGGGAESATEVRHLRESTLERVRLFVNHLGDAYSQVLRYWMDMSRQLMDKEMTIRVIGSDGEAMYPLIQKDDLRGYFDYRAKVLPSIAGQQDVNKKQSMDLFQLLSQIDPNASGIDLRKLISKTISNWGWSLDSISKNEQGPKEGEVDPAVMEAMRAAGMSPDNPEAIAAMAQGTAAQTPPPGISGPRQGSGSSFRSRFIPQDTLSGALSRVQGPAGGEQSGFSQARSPINLLSAGAPPTSPGIGTGAGGPGKRTSNPRGHNRGGKVNTNIPMKQTSSTESSLLNRSFNIQS